MLLQSGAFHRRPEPRLRNFRSAGCRYRCIRRRRSLARAPDAAITGTKKWSLPTVAALDQPQRYGELRRTVGATSRALTLTLKDLVDAGVVERRDYDDFPPGTSYRLTADGRALRDPVVSLEGALAEVALKDADVRRRRVYRQTRKKAYKAQMRAKQQARKAPNWSNWRRLSRRCPGGPDVRWDRRRPRTHTRSRPTAAAGRTPSPARPFAPRMLTPASPRSGRAG
jgi:DNA-binding HxlR family transcriptional regulator